MPRFGSPHAFAKLVDRWAFPIKALFWGASVVTIGVAVWLMTVIAWILPSHDPAHIPLWTGVTVGYLVFSGLSITYLRLGPRRAALRVLVLALSICALGAAALGAYEMFRASRRGGDFEGYLLLMSLLLAGHGLVAIAYTWITASIARKVAG